MYLSIYLGVGRLHSNVIWLFVVHSWQRTAESFSMGYTLESQSKFLCSSPEHRAEGSWPPNLEPHPTLSGLIWGEEIPSTLSQHVLASMHFDQYQITLSSQSVSICFYLFYLFFLSQFLSVLSVFICFYLFWSVSICFYLFLSILSVLSVLYVFICFYLFFFCFFLFFFLFYLFLSVFIFLHKSQLFSKALLIWVYQSRTMTDQKVHQHTTVKHNKQWQARWCPSQHVDSDLKGQTNLLVQILRRNAVYKRIAVPYQDGWFFAVAGDSNQAKAKRWRLLTKDTWPDH